ncbi:ABC transporter type 1, transmembrane domain-containing protein, partial [Ochromonadaceae sp. CCMP2298]
MGMGMNGGEGYQALALSAECDLEVGGVEMVAGKGAGKGEKEGEGEEGEVDLSWVWEMTKPERTYMVLGLIGSAMVGAAFPILGFFLARMIDVFFSLDPQEMREDAAFWALVFVGMSLTQLVGGFLSKYCFGVITERLATRVREKSFNKMLHLDVAWYDADGVTPGALAQSLATDAVAVRAIAGESTGTSVSQTVTLTVALGVALYQ